MIGLACFVVGIGAGIGAGYGIFHEDSSSLLLSAQNLDFQQWLIAVNGDNGTLSISKDGELEIQVDAIRSKSPAFTNVPYRIATLTDRETAMNFIDEGIQDEQGINVVLSYIHQNRTHMIPLVLDQQPNVTGDSATFKGLVSIRNESFEGISVPMDEVNMFVISSANPSQIQFN